MLTTVLVLGWLSDVCSIVGRVSMVPRSAAHVQLPDQLYAGTTCTLESWGGCVCRFFADSTCHYEIDLLLDCDDREVLSWRHLT